MDFLGDLRALPAFALGFFGVQLAPASPRYYAVHRLLAVGFVDVILVNDEFN